MPFEPFRDSSAPHELALSKEEMLEPYRVYHDQGGHLALLKAKKKMPKEVSHFCYECKTDKTFGLTDEPDLVDIDARCGCRFALSPEDVKKFSQGQNSFSHFCSGCGENDTWTIDWTTRREELEVFRIR